MYFINFVLFLLLVSLVDRVEFSCSLISYPKLETTLILLFLFFLSFKILLMSMMKVDITHSPSFYIINSKIKMLVPFSAYDNFKNTESIKSITRPLLLPFS